MGHLLGESAPQSVPQPERNLSPVDRFNLLLQRFEHIIESRAALKKQDICVHVPGSHLGVPAHIRLGIYVEKTGDPEPPLHSFGLPIGSFMNRHGPLLERHATFGTGTRLFSLDLRVHRAGPFS